MQSKPTYVSLFSSGGLGCYGFKQAGFQCIATAELLERRMDVQKANQVCEDPDGYIVGDLTDPQIHARILGRVTKYKYSNPNSEVTAVIATPPCQGMSVANHKKSNDEIVRNSLVLESIKLVQEIRPRYFIFENVRSFLKSFCSEDGASQKTIDDAIRDSLGPNYLIDSRVLNLKDYGSPSSRTRTIVIGSRKDLAPIIPTDLFPAQQQAVTLSDLIGDLPRMTEMGEVSPTDYLHAFRPYSPQMRNWIKDLSPGQSAFDQIEPDKRPHRFINGIRVENKAANADKYRRVPWNAVPPCVHTRNDILSSQNTVHPTDDRVFSIRELMRFMGVPDGFKWSSDETNSNPNLWTSLERQQFLKRHDTNIRQCLGEGVPTPVFQSIAENICAVNEPNSGWADETEQLIRGYEFSNPLRKLNDAYYTSRVASFALASRLPDFNKKKISILEPSVGAGALLPDLLRKYWDKEIILTLVDVDKDALKIAKNVAESCNHRNLKINVIADDFFSAIRLVGKIDLVIGNPPFSSTASKSSGLGAAGTRKLFARFLEVCMDHASYVSFIIPKSFLSSPDYWKLRTLVARRHVRSIFDFGTKVFDGVLVETIGLHIGPSSCRRETLIESLIMPVSLRVTQTYVTDPEFPTWLIYRNSFFDSVVGKCDLGIFDAYRDRSITSKRSHSQGEYPVLKAKDIGKNGIDPHSPAFFINEEMVPEQWKKLRERTDLIAVPNLSYYPRAAIVPTGVVPDGSAAILIPRTDRHISDQDLTWFSSEAFYYFYRIARNYSVRSLNVDKCSVFYWGLPKEKTGSNFLPVDRSSGKLYALPDEDLVAL